LQNLLHLRESLCLDVGPPDLKQTALRRHPFPLLLLSQHTPHLPQGLSQAVFVLDEGDPDIPCDFAFDLSIR